MDSGRDSDRALHSKPLRLGTHREGQFCKLIPLKNRPRLALIGHTYAPNHNREKAAALEKYFQVCCFVPDCSQEVIFGQPYVDFNDAEIPTGDYETVILPKVRETNSRTQLLLKGLFKALNKWQPEYVLVEAEPWSQLRWQTWLWCRKHPEVKLFEFTWENLARPGWKGAVLAKVYQRAARTNQGVVCGNQAAKSLFLEAGKEEDELLVAAQLGIPEAGFESVTSLEREEWRKKNQVSEEAVVIGFCGRFIASKGLLLLSEAVGQLRDEGLDLKLCLLGHGELGDQVQAQLKEAVLVFPPVSHGEVPAILKYWDLLVLPSQRLDEGGQVWEEQFGRVIIEAVAAGVPAIGSRHGAIPEVLGTEEAVFEEADVDSLKTKIRRFAESEKERANLLATQKKHTFGNYTHSQIASQYAHFMLK